MKNIILLLMISVLLIAFISCTSGDIPNIPDFVAAISTTYDNDTQMEAFLDNKKEITILKEKTEEGDFQERWKKIIQKDMSNNPLTEEYYRYNTIYLKRDYEYGEMQEGTRESDKPTQVLFKDSQGNIAEKELYEYDENQRLIKKTRYFVATDRDEELNHYTYEYIAENTQPSTINFFVPNEEPSPLSYNIIDYDENHNKISDELFAYGSPQSKYFYYYKDNGDLSRVEYGLYQNDSDSYGIFWTSFYQYIDGKLSKIEKRDYNQIIVAQKVF